MRADQPHSERDKYRLAQIRSIAAAEPVGSPLYVVHVGLIAGGGIGSVFLFNTWHLAAMGWVYVIVLSLEKIVAARVSRQENPVLYGLVLSLLVIRATLYNVLVFFVWAQDGDVFKLVALALMVAATINIFVFHATYPAVIFCVVAPIWIGFSMIALSLVLQNGASRESLAAIATMIGVSPYFYLTLMQANQSWEELDKAKVALTQSQKHDALGKLAAGVAHDFNNISAITLGAAEFLKDGTDPHKDALADEIIHASKRGAALSGQLLAFGRSSALEPAEHDMEDIFDELSSMLQRLLPENINTIISVQPNTPPVFADWYQLETALLNLVVNARDAMPDGGTLGLHASLHKQGEADFLNAPGFRRPIGVSISVTDTGNGIPSNIKGQVFDPFFTTKRLGEGSGLGLSMVSGFARQSGGTVHLKSEVGRGTTIRLMLPSPETCENKVQADHSSGPNGSDGHILLVEDEAALRDIVARQLAAYGHQVTTAATGDDAEKILTSGLIPQLVITDLVMPGRVQGHDLARIARNLIPKIPIIFMSGYPNHALSEQAALDPPAKMLRKPVKQEDLLSNIRAAMI